MHTLRVPPRLPASSHPRIPHRAGGMVTNYSRSTPNPSRAPTSLEYPALGPILFQPRGLPPFLFLCGVPELLYSS